MEPFRVTCLPTAAWLSTATFVGFKPAGVYGNEPLNEYMKAIKLSSRELFWVESNDPICWKPKPVVLPVASVNHRPSRR